MPPDPELACVLSHHRSGSVATHHFSCKIGYTILRLRSRSIAGKHWEAKLGFPYVSQKNAVRGGRVKLTKTSVAKELPLPEDRDKADVIYFDDDLRGFGLRIRVGGKRSYVVQYRQGTKQRRIVIGDAAKLDIDVARKAARAKLAAVALGGDPQADKVAARAKDAITLGSVVETYLAAKESTLRRKSFTEAARYLRTSWKPLHGLPLHAITRRDVAARLAKIGIENGQTAAARARAHLSSLMSWCLREGLGDANPVVGSNKPPEPKARDRVLSDGELAAIWGACKNDDFGRIVKLLMLTGCRREEIGGLRWSEVDLDRGVIALPGERTKNHRLHAVPLSGMALDVLAGCPRRAGRELVFGEGEGGFGGYGNAKRKLDHRIAKAQPIAAWRLHDLRRTVATVMAESPPDKEHPKARGLGVLPHVVEEVLGHVSGHRSGVAGVYNRAKYEREVRTALALWAEHVRAVVEGSERKVVPMIRGMKEQESA
jgi:integrase